MNATLAARFGRQTNVYRADEPLNEAQMRRYAPSIFAENKHTSRSERYTFIPTIEVLRGLAGEGFQPFMVAQARSRVAGKEAFTKHMIRLRHAAQIVQRDAANEIILINSHDGASSYQMLAGMFRFVCCNGLVAGDVVEDIRIPHKGQVVHDVIDGATRVLEDFQQVGTSVEAMRALTLSAEEQRVFSEAALVARFGERTEGLPPPPVTADQLNVARRPEDVGQSLWLTFQRVQENTERGGLRGRSAVGRRVHTRGVQGIDSSVGLNRALWTLAEGMRKLKGA